MTFRDRDRAQVDRKIERNNLIPGQMPAYVWSAAESKTRGTAIVLALGFRDAVERIDRKLRRSIVYPIRLPFTCLTTRLSKDGSTEAARFGLGLLIVAEVPTYASGRDLAIRIDAAARRNAHAKEIRKIFREQPECRPPEDLKLPDEEVWELCDIFLDECRLAVRGSP